MKRISLQALGLAALFICFSSAVFAQPEHDEMHGCRFAKNKVKLEPLTEKQLNYLVASAERSDTIDIINYDINLEIIDFTGKQIKGFTEITFTPKIDNVERILLNLLDFDVDSVYFNDSPASSYFSDELFLQVVFNPVFDPGDELKVKIWYHGRPTVDPSGFGGLDFRDGIAYNLGIGLGSNPYNYGRGWYPCFDNFVERATYDFHITSRLPRKAYCSGTFMGEATVSGDTIVRSFRLDQEIPSYLAGVAVGDFAEHNDIHDGLNADIPIQLIARPQNIQDMADSFVELGDVIDGLEYWFGPYAWNRVGYVTTQVGAMEHAENIAYPTFSAIGGVNFGHLRLMAHELGHHWWGNVAGIPGASDMWFKEGNAEYSAHLITEYIYGREPFLDQVIDNHANVLSSAHLDDGAFLPLSGIPFENTYGTHTYNKGASMMHNLRGYLGDENFRTGMTSVQQNLGFTSITADDFRDHLTSVTGVDLVNFFNDWLKSPGWSGFSTENMEVTAVTVGSTTEYQLDLDIYQGLRGATNYHTNVPVQLFIYDKDGNAQMETIMASGEYTDFSITLDFEPIFVIINDEHTLNLAQVLDKYERTDPGSYVLPFSGWIMNTSEQSGPMKIWLDRKWFGPPPSSDPNVRLASRQYWDFQGIFPEDHDLSARIQYQGNSVNSLYYDLLSETEDSLILAWRPNDEMEWVEYPDYSKNILGNPTDGIGSIIIDNLRPGQYVLANGELAMTNTNEIVTYTSNLFPNPALDQTQLLVADLPAGDYVINIYGTLGTVERSLSIHHIGNELNQSIDLSGIENGNYWISLEDPKGKVFVNQSLNILK